MSEERIFLCTKDGAHKFWRVLVEGNTQTVCWGRIGTIGQTLTREFSDSSEAQKATSALIAQKTAKRYGEVSRDEMAAFAPVPTARREKVIAPAEFQLLLPFDEPQATPIFVAPSAIAPVASENPLSLFD